MPLVRFLEVDGHPEVGAITTDHGFFQRQVAKQPPSIDHDVTGELHEQPHDDGAVQVSKRVADELMALPGVQFEVVE